MDGWLHEWMVKKEKDRQIGLNVYNHTFPSVEKDTHYTFSTIEGHRHKDMCVGSLLVKSSQVNYIYVAHFIHEADLTCFTSKP